MMTTHPEDAMTRERFARALYFAAEGLGPESWYVPENDAHWERWQDDGDDMSPSPLAVADALIAAFPALASIRQESAPSADAEDEKEAANILYTALYGKPYEGTDGYDNWLACLTITKRMVPALRRYAGDRGVTDEQVKAAVYVMDMYYETKCDLPEVQPLGKLRKAEMMRICLEAAARAKPSEKGGAR